MITEEKLIQKLTNLRISYTDLPFTVDGREKARYLGGMESMLLTLEVLDFGEPLPYTEIEEEKKNFFSKNEMVKRKETYRELILRLVDSVVKR